MLEQKPGMSKTWVPIAFLLGEALLFALSGGIVAIVVSRWGGAELLGQYSLVLAWIALFQAIANFGLTELTLRELGRVGDDGGKQITHSLLVGVFASAICMLLMTTIVLVLRYPENTRHALLLGVLMLTPMTVSSISRAGFLAHGRPASVFIVALVESTAAGIVNCYLAVTGHGVVALAVTMLGMKAITSLLSLRLLKKGVARLRPVFDPAFCRRLISTMLTFGLGNILGTLSMRINLILLSVWATLPAVGLFAAASKVMELTLMIPAIFAQVLLPRLARSFAQHRAGEVTGLLKSTLPWMFGIVAALSVGIAAFAPSVLRLLFGPEFVAASSILRVLMLFLIVESIDTVLSITLKAAGHERLDVRLFTGNVVVNIVATLLLVFGWGGLGCALAKILGSLASSIPRGAAASRLVGDLAVAKSRQ